MTYSDKLQDPRWQKKRLEVLELSGWKCQRCGSGLADATQLHVHHKAYGFGEPWEIENRFLVVLCKRCHGQEHSRSLWLKREGLSEWPLTLPGQEHFFGYIVGLGVLVDEDAPEGFSAVWAEFAYKGCKDKFDTPCDSNLISKLFGFLLANMEADSPSAKVWVKLTQRGYEVEMP